MLARSIQGNDPKRKWTMNWWGWLLRKNERQKKKKKGKPKSWTNDPELFTRTVRLASSEGSWYELKPPDSRQMQKQNTRVSSKYIVTSLVNEITLFMKKYMFRTLFSLVDIWIWIPSLFVDKLVSLFPSILLAHPDVSLHSSIFAYSEVEKGSFCDLLCALCFVFVSSVCV